MDREKTIYYEGDDLLLSILFENKRDIRDFDYHLSMRALSYSTINQLTVDKEIGVVLFTTTIPESIRASDYKHSDSASPNHSLATSDYRSDVRDDYELVLGDMNDAYHQLQMIENPNHPLLYGKGLYRCHLESQAANKTAASDSNNILWMSWGMHQQFDGLNLTNKQHLVPSIAIEFVNFEYTEYMELVGGYPIQKDKVTISIDSPDPKILEGVGLVLKDGSTFQDGKWFTYVHVDSYKEFERFLTIKYNETKRLWGKGLTISAPISKEDLQSSRAKRTRGSLKNDT